MSPLPVKKTIANAPKLPVKQEVVKAPLKAPVKKDKKRHTTDKSGLPSFNTYITTLLSDLNNDVGLTSKARSEVLYMTHDLIRRLALDALYMRHRQTLSVRDMSYATRLTLSNNQDLCDKVMEFADRTVGKYCKSNKGRNVSREDRAGLTIRISRCATSLRRLYNFSRIGETTPVFVAAVLEYVISQVLVSASNVAKQYKKSRITARHLLLALADNDNYLRKAFSKLVLSGGVPVQDLKPIEKK